MSRQPTTDLYFLNAMRALVRPRWPARLWHPAHLWRRAPIRRLGESSFVTDDWFVLVRRDKPYLMREALAWGGRLAYVIDDDIQAGIACEALPETYRARLQAFAKRFHRDLLARADVVLAASDALAQALLAQPQMQRRLAPRLVRIDPVWRQPLADLAHFDALEHYSDTANPNIKPATLKMVMLGTGSHAGALAQMAPWLADLLAAHPHTSLTYFAPRRVDDTLEKHPRARRLEPMTWREYQRWMAHQRFHLALYPLAQTGFDRARSASKITEHAILGAAGLYPAGWAPASAMGQAALLAPDDPAQWRAAIEQAVARRAGLREIAQAAQRQLACHHPAAVQQALWLDLLGIGN